MNGYIMEIRKGHPRGVTKDNYVYRSILVVEAVLGKPLLPPARVHHVDGNRSNDAHTNLVVCQDAAYHNLLEKRTRALKACGHAAWLKCRICKRWDTPENLRIIKSNNSTTQYHNPCMNTYNKRRYWQCKSYDSA